MSPGQSRPRRRVRRREEIPLSALAPYLEAVLQEERESVLLGSRASEIVFEGFTPRQQQVVALLREGYTRTEIAQRLGISRTALHKLLKRIRRRLLQGLARVERSEILQLYLSEARRHIYRPPRCCPKGKEACYYTSICPFVDT